MRFFLYSALFVLLAVLVSGCAPDPYYTGPESDHFNGKHFFDPLNPSPRKFGDFLKWKLTSKKAEWPHQVDLYDYPPPPERVDGEALVVSWVNHATVLVQTGGLNLLTDPVFSERTSPFSWIGPKRVHNPGIPLHELPPIDVVLISHDHYDALDIQTLEQLWERDEPLILCGLGVDSIIRKESSLPIQVKTLDWWDHYKVREDFVVTFTPVQHWSKRWLWDYNYTLWGGFVVEAPVGNIFFGGDSGYSAYFQQIGEKFQQFKLALIPIGAFEPRWFMAYAHINPEESVRVFEDLNTDFALGIHWGTFQLTDESREKPVTELHDALKSAELSVDRFRVLAPGEIWEVAY